MKSDDKQTRIFSETESSSLVLFYDSEEDDEEEGVGPGSQTKPRD